jgi:hypothetical protein
MRDLARCLPAHVLPTLELAQVLRKQWLGLGTLLGSLDCGEHGE